MPMRTPTIRRSITIVVLASWLAACGGGGSGSSAAAPLLPTPPSPGEVLAEDASAFRPLRPGAVYEYRGVTVLGANYVPTTYRNTVTQSAAAAGDTLETSSNWFGQGEDAMPLRRSGGQVISRQAIDLGGVGSPALQDVVELRSPVRHLDQYTVLDRRFAEGVQDADGDGKPEAVDIAAYRVVMGIETLTLHNLEPRSALRVDFVTLARVQLSRDGRLGPVVSIVQRTWYAEGIGVVKQQLELPREGAPNDVTIHTEQLLSWDGVTSGLGIVRPRAANAPSNTAGAAGAALQNLVGEPIRHGAGAAVVAEVIDGAGVAYRSLSLIGANGQVARTTLLREWQNDGRSPHLASAAGHIALILPNEVRDGYLLSSFDGNLARQTPVPGLPLDLGPTSATDPNVDGHGIEAVQSDGQRLWVLYRRYFVDSSTQLLLRAFDLGAQPASAEYPLESMTEPRGASNPQLSASPRRVVVSWTGPSSSQTRSLRHAVLDAGAAAPIVSTLTSAMGSGDTIVQPSSAGSLATLMWGSALETGAPNTGGIRGVEVGSDGVPIRTVPGALDDERLGALWQPGMRPGRFVLREDADRLVFVHQVQAAAWPDAASETNLLQVSVVARQALPLPAQMAEARRMRLPPELISEFSRNWQPSHTILLDDRLLMLGLAGGSQLRTAVVWHR